MITMIYAYYENPIMLQRHLEIWKTYPDEVKRGINAILVDDGSPVPLDIEVVKRAEIGFKVSVFRTLVDVPWNQDAARNIGAKAASKGYLLLTDMDHAVPPDLIARLVKMEQAKKIGLKMYYTFGRVTAPHMKDYKPHPNSYLMSRYLYWKVGGYDEQWAGYYGTDGIFRRNLKRTARGHRHLQGFDLIRYPRHYVLDAGCERYPRKEGRTVKASNKIKNESRIKFQSKDKPTVFRFPYEQVL